MFGAKVASRYLGLGKANWNKPDMALVAGKEWRVFSEELVASRRHGAKKRDVVSPLDVGCRARCRKHIVIPEVKMITFYAPSPIGSYT